MFSQHLDFIRLVVGGSTVATAAGTISRSIGGVADGERHGAVRVPLSLGLLVERDLLE